MKEALVVSARRTPIGRAVKGSLSEVRPDDLVAGVIADAVAHAGLDPARFDDHALGTAYPEGKQGANLARRASLLAGLSTSVPGSTINRFCASSLQALRIATHALWSGEAGAYLVSGVESISQVGRTTRPEDQHPSFLDGSLPDVYISMGLTAEKVARQYDISREDMDTFAFDSHRKAVAATDAGGALAQHPAGRVARRCHREHGRRAQARHNPGAAGTASRCFRRRRVRDSRQLVSAQRRSRRRGSCQ